MVLHIIFFLLIGKSDKPKRKQLACHGGRVAWYSRSPDLNPLDFYLWGYLQSTVFTTEVSDMETLQQRMRQIWYDLVWFGTIWYDLLWFGTILVWFGTIWYDLVWFGMILTIPTVFRRVRRSLFRHATFCIESQDFSHLFTFRRPYPGNHVSVLHDVPLSLIRF